MLQVVHTEDGGLRLTVREASAALPTLMEWHKAHDIPIESIREYQPSFDEVFVQLVERNGS